MQDDILTSFTPAKGSRSLRGFFATALIAFLLGGGLVGWLAFNGTISLGGGAKAPDPALSATIPATEPRQSLAASPSPSASPSPAPLEQPALAGAFDQRVAALETRLNDLSLRADAASGNATRAEGLLIAFATRRAIERGSGLGDLADQLRLRFGEAEPQAVRTVLDAAPQGLTLDKLVAELDRLGPQLTGHPANEGGWDRVRREVGSLFEIKRGGVSDGDPIRRLELARLLLRSGQIAKARDAVLGLPGKDAAGTWLATANRYESVEAALDRLELAALKEPRQLKNGAGEPVATAPAT